MMLDDEIKLYYKIRNKLIEEQQLMPSDHDFVPCMLFVGVRAAIRGTNFIDTPVEKTEEIEEIEEIEEKGNGNRISDEDKLKKVFLSSGGAMLKRGRIVQIWQDLYGESSAGIDKKLKTFVEQGVLTRESGRYSLQKV
jgi:hypothetical protein